jgi:hypothetical protein
MSGSLSRSPERQPNKADNWMQTYTGKVFVYADPDPASICVEDVAHSLASQCRYNGHTRYFYSVAQHSVHVARECGGDHELWGLLHDAAEAYTGDVVQPLKGVVSGFARIERRVERAVWKALGLKGRLPRKVRDVDARVFATEVRDLMADPWAVDAKPYRWRIEPMPPHAAEAAFLEMYRSWT